MQASRSRGEKGRFSGASGCVDRREPRPYGPRLNFRRSPAPDRFERDVMKVLRSLKSAKTRHRDCRVVRRKGRVYVINKTNPRFKARQG